MLDESQSIQDGSARSCRGNTYRRVALCLQKKKNARKNVFRDGQHDYTGLYFFVPGKHGETRNQLKKV